MYKRRKNQGIALITVVLAMAIVGTLGVTILYAAYGGLSMRLVKKASVNNFYSAESVMNEIAAGLERHMAEKYAAAYTTVMTEYGNYESAADMQQAFRTEYILSLVEELHYVDLTTNTYNDNEYDVELLKGFVNAARLDGGTFAVSADAGRAGGNQLQTLEDGVILRNVKVTYTKGSYNNSIVSDIKLMVPKVDFVMATSLPDISAYSCIADAGITVNAGVSAEISGAAYAGDPGDRDAAKEGDPAIELKAGSVLTAANSPLMVAKGDILVTGQSEFATGGAETASSRITSLWARNVTGDLSSAEAARAGNTIALKGRTYVADDITLNGTGNKLTLWGQFYGYSSGTDTAANSSALIVNGGNTTLDMSGLDTMVLAGTAFVKASGVSASKTAGGVTANVTANAEGAIENQDIFTGDSVALKANQYAYLVPDECDGVPCNPMSYAQYNTMVGDGDKDGDGTADWINRIRLSQLSALNRSLASYGDVDIVPVFSAEQGGTVYLYMKFREVSQASAYFMDVFGSDSPVGNKIRSYMDNYLTGVSFNTNAAGDLKMTRVITGGAWLKPGTYDSAAGTWKPVYTEEGNEAGIIAQELYNYAKNYSSLCTKLVEGGTSITTEEESRTVFQNLILESAFDNTDGLFAHTRAEGAEITTLTGVGKVWTFSDPGNTVRAILVDNEEGSAYETSGGRGLILATGDVTVKGNWNGIIICKGRLTVTANARLTGDEAATCSAIRLSCTVQDSTGTPLPDINGDPLTFSVMNFFRGGESYRTAQNGVETTGRDMSDVRNCLAYENWSSN